MNACCSIPAIIFCDSTYHKYELGICIIWYPDIFYCEFYGEHTVYQAFLPSEINDIISGTAFNSFKNGNDEATHDFSANSTNCKLSNSAKAHKDSFFDIILDS